MTVAASATLFPDGLRHLLATGCWTGGTVKAALFGVDYDPASHADTYADAAQYEASGAGYTAGGVALANCTVERDTNGTTIRFRADPALWSDLTITARWLIIYDSSGDGQMIAYARFATGYDLTSEAGNGLQIFWSAAGIISVEVAS